MKVIEIIKKAITLVFVVLAVSMMIFTIVSVSTFDRVDRDIFGYKAFIVLSDSMKGEFDAGDLVLVKEVDPTTLQVGDIIAYTSQNTESFGETITHKIREVKTDDQGNLGFITYGISTDTNDETLVTSEYVIGEYQNNLPGIGKFFQFLKTTPGYIVCILIPFLVLIVIEGVRCINLFKQYKAEQQAELQAQRDKIEEERAENQRMMQELLAMKKEMEEKQASSNQG